MLDLEIKDGKGGKSKAGVTDDNELLVIQSPYPPFLPQKIRPFRQYLTDDGLSTGSNDMGVDGSSTNVDFYVSAVDGFDRYITSLNIIVGYGTSSQPYLFADAAALTNGSLLYYKSYLGEVNIHDGIKTNQDMFRLSDDPITSLWEIRGVNALNDYGYFVSVDLRVISAESGIKLDEGTNQKIAMKIRDDATNADSFNVIVYGFERFK